MLRYRTLSALLQILRAASKKDFLLPESPPPQVARNGIALLVNIGEGSLLAIYTMHGSPCKWANPGPLGPQTLLPASLTDLRETSLLFLPEHTLHLPTSFLSCHGPPVRTFKG